MKISKERKRFFFYLQTFSPIQSLHAKLPGGIGMGVVVGCGSSEVPSKEPPATLLLRQPALTRAHSLLHPGLLSQNRNLGQGSARTKQNH